MSESRRVLFDEAYRFIKYGLVGVLNTAVCVTTMYACRTLGLGYQLYTLVGYTVAIIFSFFMNKQFTFNYKAGNKRAVIIRMVRFVSISVSLLLLVQLLQWLFIEQMLFPEIPGIGIPMVFYTAVGFVLNRFWVFTERSGLTEATNLLYSLFSHGRKNTGNRDMPG